MLFSINLSTQDSEDVPAAELGPPAAGDEAGGDGDGDERDDGGGFGTSAQLGQGPGDCAEYRTGCGAEGAAE